MQFWTALRDTLELKGYRIDRSYSGPGRAYVGTEIFNQTELVTKITICDDGFVVRPKFTVEGLEETKGLVAHLDEHNTFCYAAPESLVLDRTNPGGSILLCREIFLKELHKALSGEDSREIANELPRYWRGIAVSSDIGPDVEGPCRLYVWRSKDLSVCLLTNNQKLLDYYRTHVCPKFRFTEEKYYAELIRYDDVSPFFSFNRNSTSLSDYLSWLKGFGKDFPNRILTVLSSRHSSSTAVFLNGDHGAYGIMPMQLPIKFRSRNPFHKQQGGELISARGRRLMLERYADNTEVERFMTSDIADGYVYGRSLIKRVTLENLKICVIGCGTIGSHFAKFAAQSGAGSGTNSLLTLVDNQTHKPGNIGRHLLGFPQLGHNKAKAVKELLSDQFPEKNISTITSNAYEALGRLFDYDLVVEATGDEVLSNAVNACFQKNAAEHGMIAQLYVWLEGLGAAAQALLVNDTEKACYRCLTPEFEGNDRFSPLKERENNYLVDATCSDGPYIPYSVASAATAAGLALELALDWAAGDPKPKLRTRLIDADPEITKIVKDRSPDKHEKCPVCFPTT